MTPADDLVRLLAAERDRLLLPVVRWMQRQIERSPLSRGNR